MTTDGRTPHREAADTAPASPGLHGVRRDIQGLRALAVVAVLVFHLWPEALSGGYVGVDIFFVISGFLITGHLLRTIPSRRSDVVAFYASRVRRLAPAATLVILVTLLASSAVQPSSMLTTTAREAAAAALYVENWELAGSATDYLESMDAASPLQHFWSLSVEEQFYLGWPLLIGGLALIARKSRARLSTVLFLGLAAVFVGSLIASVYLTRSDPQGAYFVTHTRVWELALGGLLSLAVANGLAVRPRAMASAVMALGTLMMIGSIVMFDSSTPFPGSLALVPTVGAALAILASPGAIGSPLVKVLSHPLSQYVGDRSYAVYLWHWPLVVLSPFVLGREPGTQGKAIIVILTLGLAAGTKRWVEDPLRSGQLLRDHSGRSLVAGFVCIVSVLVASTALVTHISKEQTQIADQVRSGLSGETPCFAVQATRQPGCEITGGTLLTTPAFAAADKPDVYADDCWANRPFSRHRTCTYGSSQGPKRIALLGNSHAGHWQPALVKDAEAQGWQITTYLVSECYPVFVPVSFSQPELTENCGSWTSWAIESIAEGDYDLVVASARTLQPLVDVATDEQRARAKAAYGETLRRLTARGTPVLVIRDVPGMPSKVPDCIAVHLDVPAACDRPERDAVPRDPLADAARADESGLASVVDPNPLLCPDDVCRSVIGGVIVFFDHGHLTKTMSTSLAPEIQGAMRRRMKE